MADMAKQYEKKSWILYHVLNRFIGSPEMVATRRKLILMTDQIINMRESTIKRIQTGSSAEGMAMKGSDYDMMYIDNSMKVICSDEDLSIPPDTTNKPVFLMRDAGNQPGYVMLELVSQRHASLSTFGNSIVKVDDALFISSEIHRQSFAECVGAIRSFDMSTHGPAATTSWENTYNTQSTSVDIVCSLPCPSWPREANEWISRPRLHGWPQKALREQIVEDGCHLVPIGDKTSDDTFLQWRISFTSAERKLIHSLTHIQFLVYGLLKYLLKQMSNKLQQSIGEEDILSSYIMKTITFYTVESTPGSLWQEKHTFLCFMLCVSNLICCVKAGNCPNYFIHSNNMFLGKIHGEKQQKLLRILSDLRDMGWECLSYGTFITPSLGMRIKSLQNGDWTYVLPTPTRSEIELDVTIFSGTFEMFMFMPFGVHHQLLTQLHESKSDIDEFIAYFGTARALSCSGMDNFEKHVTAKGNKEKYKYLKKCKTLLVPLSSVCASPGLLWLATYYYQTGNYGKSIKLCQQIISSFKMEAVQCSSVMEDACYEENFCGRGYNLLRKCHEVFVSHISFQPAFCNFCPFHLHAELEKRHCDDLVQIPHLPYALFVIFLCYYEVGDSRKCHQTLCNLQTVKSDPRQGGQENWIVHNILGICYEMIGDIDGAVEEYKNSLKSPSNENCYNPAAERIILLQFLRTVKQMWTMQIRDSAHVQRLGVHRRNNSY